MKLIVRNFLTIAMTSMTIFLCGYGTGFLLGEKKGIRSSTAIGTLSPSAEEQQAPWVKRTLKKFSSELQLTPKQKKKVNQEITKTYEAMLQSRLSALKQYSSHLITLHDRLLPYLTQPQQQLLRKQRDQLKETLDLGLQ